MNLPDFKNDLGLTRLRDHMGADLNLSYSADRVWEDATLLEILAGTGVDVDGTEVDVDGDGLLEYKGQRVLLYIRDQYQNDNYEPREYKYHIAHCRTLERMWDEGRSKRYVVATRADGNFHVVTHFQPSDREEEGLREMNVCKNCLSFMRAEHPETSELWEYSEFDLGEFFETYSTRHTEIPVHTPETLPPDRYPDNWDKISLSCRERAGWTCQSCGRKFSQNRYRLQTHHKDRQRWNNDPSNLEALCVECHRHKTGHRGI